MGATRLSAAFAEVIREQRAKRGLSQEDLAHDADLHRTYVGLIERGLMRIPMKSATHSDRSRTPVPADVGHLERCSGRWTHFPFLVVWFLIDLPLRVILCA